MPVPSNTTRGTATVIPSNGLPYSVVQDVNDSGTTYPVWYQWTAPVETVIKVFGFGGYGAYQPELEVYEGASVSIYMDLGQLTAPINVPVYLPVTAGETYFFTFYMLTGIFANPAELSLTLDAIPTLPIVAGDFLNNLEVDGDAEGPMSVLSGSTSQTVKLYQQMATPAAVRGTAGLPHGSQGVSLLNGSFGWMDDQHPNFKLYGSDLALVVAVTLPSTGVAFGVSRVLDRVYVVYGSSGSRTVRAYSNVGVLVETWATTIAAITRLAVNDDGTILYYGAGGSSAIKRWDLTLNIAMGDLVADTAGYEITDILCLEDDTVVASWLQESGAASGYDVKAKHYSEAGATLLTYEFGATWRSSFNVPRIGFALDSPTHFWITLKPQGQNDVSLFKKVTVSGGAIATTLTHVNYLAEVQLGLTDVTYPKTTGTINTFTATYPSRTVDPPSTVTYTLITSEAFDRTMQMTITAAEDFIPTQPTFEVGRTGNTTVYFPSSTFTNALSGATWVLETTIPAGTDVIITEAESVNLNTGSLSFSVPVVYPVSQSAILTTGAGQTSTVVVSVRETFADGTGMQPLFDIGRTGDTDSIAPSSTFTDAPEGDSFEFDVTLTAGQDVVVTATRAIGNATGSIHVDVYETPANQGVLGAEKSGALLVANAAYTPPTPPFPTIVYPDFEIEELPRRWLRRAPIQSSENRRLRHNYLNIDFEGGVGASDGQGAVPQAMLRWSDDSGHTWSSELWRSMGRIGKWGWRAVWWRLGMARNRVYEVSGTDPVKVAIVDAYVDVEGGTDAPSQ